jgi:hypothetical protein
MHVLSDSVGGDDRVESFGNKNPDIGIPVGGMDGDRKEGERSKCDP